MRVVFDTNFFIAAALKGGFSEDILKIASSTNFVDIICSEKILDELKQKLAQKFQWNETEIVFFVETIQEICEMVQIKEKINVITRDPADDKILECAVSGNADLIVTSDQDLLSLKTFQGIGIVHPKTLTWTFPDIFRKLKK